MKLIEFIKAYNKAGTWTLAIVMCYLFMKAWQNNYEWGFTINLYEEATIESILIMLWLVSILVLTIHRYNMIGGK